MILNETTTWHVAATDKPDSDITVLCFDGENFFCGYWADDSGWWIDCSSGGRVDACTHWAEPHGPI